MENMVWYVISRALVSWIIVLLVLGWARRQSDHEIDSFRGPMFPSLCRVAERPAKRPVSPNWKE